LQNINWRALADRRRHQDFAGSPSFHLPRIYRSPI
jgi:hypothetical protein